MQLNFHIQSLGYIAFASRCVLCTALSLLYRIVAYQRYNNNLESSEAGCCSVYKIGL